MQLSVWVFPSLIAAIQPIPGVGTSVLFSISKGHSWGLPYLLTGPVIYLSQASQALLGESALHSCVVTGLIGAWPQLLPSELGPEQLG